MQRLKKEGWGINETAKVAPVEREQLRARGCWVPIESTAKNPLARKFRRQWSRVASVSQAGERITGERVVGAASLPGCQRESSGSGGASPEIELQKPGPQSVRGFRARIYASAHAGFLAVKNQ